METLEIGGQPFVTGTKDRFTIATRERPTRLIWPILGIALALVLQLAAIGAAMTQQWSFWEWVALAALQGMIVHMLYASIKSLTSGHITLLHVDRVAGSGRIERRYISRMSSEPVALADIQGFHISQSLDAESLPSLGVRLSDRVIDLGTLSAMVDTRKAIAALGHAQELTGLPWAWDKLVNHPHLDFDQPLVDLPVHSTYDPNAPPPVKGYLLAVFVAIIAGIGALATEGNSRVAMAAVLAVSAIPLTIEFRRMRERWQIRSVRLDRTAPHLTVTENRRGGSEARTAQVPLTDVTGFEVKPPADETAGELLMTLRDGRKIAVLQSSATAELDDVADRLRARLGLTANRP